MTMTIQAMSTDAEETIRRATGLTRTPTINAVKDKPRMVRLTVNLPSDLVESLRDAVYWTPGLTLAWMIARAVRISMAELESANQGPFPKRSKPLRAGRPRLLGQSMKVQPQLPTSGASCSGEGSLRARVVSESSME